MAFTVIHSDGNLVHVEISGKLTREDYEQFVPLTEEKIRQHKKIRLLVVMRDFHGWDAGALWEEIKYDLRHFADLERVAIVGDSKWEKGMTLFCKPFTSATVQYFDLPAQGAAEAWVRQ